MNHARPTVLLTGASGVVGRALIDELSADHRLICLYHRTPIDDPRVETLRGDITSADAGLTAEELDTLTGRLDLVLHCGAATSWRTPADEIRRTNLDGTAQMISIARRAGARLMYMSTAFVARDSPDGEQPGRADTTGVTAYIKSKVAAETLVRDSGLRWSIVRPSVLIGDSRDGRIAALQGIHKVLGAVYHGTLPVLPADASSRIDFIPQDVVARAVGRLVREPADGREHWLTAGEQALTLDEMVRRTNDLAARNGQRPDLPRMVPVEAVHRLLLPLLDDILPRPVRRQFSAFTELMLLFQSPTALPSSLPALGMTAEVAHATLATAMIRSVERMVA